MTAINRILIVDDEDNVRRMLSTAFALQGFETHCANNGRTALHLSLIHISEPTRH